MHITETSITLPGRCMETSGTCLHLSFDELVLLTVALESFRIENCEPSPDFVSYDAKLVTPKKISAFVKTLSEMTHYQTFI